jgi:archaellum biogenesis ATPase FlaH
MLTEKVHTGIDVLEDAWAGLYRGAAYLLYGRVRDGRNLVALKMVRTALASGQTCMLVSPRHPRDIAIQGSSLGLDLDGACRDGSLRVLRTPQGLDAEAGDETIAAALDTLRRASEDARVDLLVIEDFTPFVRFQEFDSLRAALLLFLDSLGQIDTTTVLCLGEPANVHSREIVAFLRSHSAGAIHIAADAASRESTARILTLQPAIDSLDKEVAVTWDLARLLRPAGAGSKDARRRSSGDGIPHREHPIPRPRQDEAPAVDVIAAPAVQPEPHFAAPGPSAIQYFDPRDPYGPTPDVRDPFAHVGTRHGLDLGRGHYMVSEPEPPPSPAGDEPASEAPAGPPTTAPETPAASVPRPRPSLAVPPQFARAFDAARRARAESRTPFLLLGLRLSETDQFEQIAAAVRSAAGRGDVVLAHAPSRRLALIMPGRQRGAGRELVRDARAGLRERGLQAAAAALGTASMIIVPDGGPFQTAGEFLAFVVHDG